MKNVFIVLNLFFLTSCDVGTPAQKLEKVEKPDVHQMEVNIKKLKDDKKSGIVRHSDGTYAYPWRERYSCKTTNECSNEIISDETGEVAFSNNKWNVGFIETGNDKEILKK